MYTELLISVVPQTTVWSSKIAAIMIASNLACIIAARQSNQQKNNRTSLSLGSLSNFSLPELLGSTSLGHIVGSGIILGLGYIHSL